jgi:hexosaminidase
MRHIVRMNELVKKRGRQTLVWEGFPNDGSEKVKIPKDILVMAFENTYNPAPNLVKHGYTVINTAWTPLYVVNAIRQTPEHIWDWNLSRFGRFSTDYAKTAWTDIPPTPQVVGAQMCSWEQPAWLEVPSLRERLPAMSERTWNPDAGGTFADYAKRAAAADRLFARLVQPVAIKAEGFLAPDPSRARDEPTTGLGYDEYLFATALRVTLVLAAPAGADETIRYTLDGSEPTAASPVYEAPLTLTEKDAKPATPNANFPHVMQATVKARAFRGDKPAGWTATQFYRYHYIGALPRKVRMTLYEVGAKTDTVPDDPSGLKRVASGAEPWTNLRGLPHMKRPARYAAVFEGKIDLKAAGDYELQLRSFGGTSRLFIDGRLVVDRRATDWGETQASAALKEGPHDVKVEYVGESDFMTAGFRPAGTKDWRPLDGAFVEQRGQEPNP